MKNFKTSDVQDVCNKLTANGATTTNLDIKKELRKVGFWATQEGLSDFMALNHAFLGLDWTFNGQYRSYFVATQPTSNDDDDDNSTISSGGLGNIGTNFVATNDPKSSTNPKVKTGSNLVTVNYTKRNGDNISSVQVLAPRAKYWMVTTTFINGVRNLAYFSRSHSRDDVRRAMANHSKVHFHNTRSKTVKA